MKFANEAFADEMPVFNLTEVRKAGFEIYPTPLMRTFFNPTRNHQVCYAEKGEGDNIEGGYFLSSINELDVEKKKAENLCPDCNVYCEKRFIDGRCE